MLFAAAALLLSASGCATTTKAPSPKDCTELHPEIKGCYWHGTTRGYCGGVSPPPEIARQRHAECVCHGCRNNADCRDRPGGRCELLPAHDHCNAAARACLYEGDRCPPEGAKQDRSADGPMRWNHDGRGGARCAYPVQKRP